MALTIQASPAAYSSMQDSLIWTVAYPAHTSDPTTYPNYKYIADIYIGGVNVDRIKKVPHPVTGIGIFDIGMIVRDYATIVFDPAPNVLKSQELGNGNFFVSVTIHFGEEYGFTEYLDVTVDYPHTVFNNYNGRLVGSTSSLVGKSDAVVTNRPYNNQTFLTSPYNFISYFPASLGAVSVVVTPNVGSVYSTTITPSDYFALQMLNVSPVALNAMQAGTITAATTYYTVAINGQTFRFNVICEAIYQTYMVHFLNQYGGFESKIFSKVSRKTIDIVKKDFGKLPYMVDSSGNVGYRSANGVYNESRSVYSSQYNEKLALNSDFLNDQEYSWLGDLALSPMVYIEDGGYFFPCVITDTNYEAKKVVNDDLTNLTINLEYGNQLNAQYR